METPLMDNLLRAKAALYAVLVANADAAIQVPTAGIENALAEVNRLLDAIENGEV